MSSNNRKWLRSPSERVGTLSHADLPPPSETASQESEEQLLISALRARDEHAFESLLDRWYSPMLRLAQTYVRSRADAEEVVQDTWLAVLDGIDRFEGRSTLRTWIFRILVNRARTRARKESRTVPLTDLRLEEMSGRDRPAADPHETLVNAELRTRIEMAIRALPARQQQVITLRDIEGWDAEEVCEALDLTASNQRVLLHRARTKVRDALFADPSPS